MITITMVLSEALRCKACISSLSLSSLALLLNSSSSQVLLPHRLLLSYPNLAASSTILSNSFC